MKFRIFDWRMLNYWTLLFLLLIIAGCSYRQKEEQQDDIRGKWKIVNSIGMYHTFPKMDLRTMYDSCIDGSVLITDSMFFLQSKYTCIDSNLVSNFKYKFKGIETIEEDSLKFQPEFCYFIFRINNIRNVKVFNAHFPVSCYDYDSINLYSINKDKLILSLCDELIILKRYSNDTVPPVEPFEDRPW